MNMIAKALSRSDWEKHPHEDAFLHLLSKVKNMDATIIAQARAAGIPWEAILNFIVQYGPQAMDLIQGLIEALRREPPVPPSEEGQEEEGELPVSLKKPAEAKPFTRPLPAKPPATAQMSTPPLHDSKGQHATLTTPPHKEDDKKDKTAMPPK